jgi:hypothetical protein
MARKKQSQISKRTIVPTLIGAGITEQWYFTHLKALKQLHVQIRPRFFGNEQIHALEKNVEIVLASEGMAIVVFDSDVTTWNEVEKQRLAQFRKKYAKNGNVLLCDSMPSIEFWFLLHYLSTNRHFGTSKAVITELKKFMPQFDKTERFLKNPSWVTELCANGKLEKAMQTAETMGTDCDSYSNVWKVMKQLFQVDIGCHTDKV